MQNNFCFLQQIELKDSVCHEIASVYISSGWGQAEHHPDDTIRKMFQTAHFILCLDAHSHIVGLLRAFSDGVMVSWLAEIVVMPEWRNKGLGTAMIQLFLQDFPHTPVYVEALPESVPWFQKHGILPISTLVACCRTALKS